MSVLAKRVAVLGGDRRMIAAVEQLASSGLSVRVTGLPVLRPSGHVEVYGNLHESIRGADLALLPVQGMAEEDRIFTLPSVQPCHLSPGDLEAMAPGGVVLAGISNHYLAQACTRAGRRLIEYREADEFATYNAIPSAEGAIGMAMEAAPFTIFGSRSVVLGFGRTGKALALLLKGLFSDVTVVVRRDVDKARVWASGYRPATYDQLPELLAESDLVFNTVPAMVLPRPLLAEAPSHLTIIDVASAPGGTDFGAAKELGITALLAPGLPGIVAPTTAGRFIAELVLRHLSHAEAEGGEQL